MIKNSLRERLCHLGDTIRSSVIAAKASASESELSSIAAETKADTIYGIDKITEATILDWFAHHWPKSEPVQIVMEGIDDEEVVTFPVGLTVGQTKWKCIIDPIDGTRCIMYDKRPAWALAGIAPQHGSKTNLAHIEIAAMTELPTSKQTRVDQLSAVTGRGLIAKRLDLTTGITVPLVLQPSTATDYRHGFASLAKFFPMAKGITAQIEENLWKELLGSSEPISDIVFDDQYLTTGGQIYELIAGHDRMIGDLRPLAFERLHITSALTCHPYDICNALLLREAGGIIEKPLGGTLDAPLDTTSPVAWVGYANATLAEKTRPVLQRLISTHLS